MIMVRFPAQEHRLHLLAYQPDGHAGDITSIKCGFSLGGLALLSGVVVCSP